jgi:C-terminal processing protease CtpA/Prc
MTLPLATTTKPTNTGHCPGFRQRSMDKPVYVLTSHGTFSGGEEFTFDLKTQKRATIVGEATGGRGPSCAWDPCRRPLHHWRSFRTADQPVTKGDWEGTGVELDVKVSAADALATAEKLAAEKLANKSKPE